MTPRQLELGRMGRAALLAEIERLEIRIQVLERGMSEGDEQKQTAASEGSEHPADR